MLSQGRIRDCRGVYGYITLDLPNLVRGVNDNQSQDMQRASQYRRRRVSPEPQRARQLQRSHRPIVFHVHVPRVNSRLCLEPAWLSAAGFLPTGGIRVLLSGHSCYPSASSSSNRHGSQSTPHILPRTYSTLGDTSHPLHILDRSKARTRLCALLDGREGLEPGD